MTEALDALGNRLPADSPLPVWNFVASRIRQPLSTGASKGRWFRLAGAIEHLDSPPEEGEYAVDESSLVRCLWRALPARTSDLIDVACVVHNVDKLASRRRSGSTHGARAGERVLRVEVPVRDPDCWRSVAGRLASLLDYMTGDVWHFRFVPLPDWARGGATMAALPCLESGLEGQRVTVCLFSGGLDALAGVATALMGAGLAGDASMPAAGGPFLLASARTNEVVGRVQEDLFAALRRAFPQADLRRVGMPTELHWRSADGDDGRSARTRGFLFLALGAAVAVTAGARCLYVYENGVGALNVRYHHGQSRADMSRSVHPGTLWGMQRFLEAVLGCGSGPAIVNPFVGQTKGQMCRALPRATLAELVPLTVSCDAFPQHRRGPRHCGLCTSCVLRRLSLWAAGLGQADARTRYRTDLLEMGPNEHLAGGSLVPIRAMEQQIAVLRRCLGVPGSDEARWRALERAFHELSGAADELAITSGAERAMVAGRLVGLYREYVAEWEAFVPLLAPVVLEGASQGMEPAGSAGATGELLPVGSG